MPAWCPLILLCRETIDTLTGKYSEQLEREVEKIKGDYQDKLDQANQVTCLEHLLLVSGVITFLSLPMAEKLYFSEV